MFGFIWSVLKFFGWWFLIGVAGAFVQWWNFIDYVTFTLGWMWIILEAVYTYFVEIGNQVRAL